MTASTPTGATFYFDPGCPWTWLTARWLLEAGAARDLELRWRTFSLAVLNGGAPVPPQGATPASRPGTAVAGQALRVVEAAVAEGDDAAAGRFYAEFGQRFHAPGAERSLALVAEAADAAGVTSLLERSDDPALDDRIVASLEEGVRLAGPDIGSPVLHVDGTDRGLFGPIVSPAPAGEEAGRLWDAVVALTAVPSFFEIKHGRPGPPGREAMEAASAPA